MEKFSKLFIIRHGQTDWNAERRLQGSIDRPLDEVGKEQARKMGEMLSLHKIGAIYSSPQTRAKQTAESIAVHHSCNVRYETDLREGSFGSLIEGLTREEYHVKYEKEINEKNSAPFDERMKYKIVPDAESEAEIAARVIPCLHKICQNHLEQNVIIVSHGGVIRTLLMLVGGFDDHTVTITNTGLIEITGNGSHLSLLNHQGVSFLKK